MSTFELRPYQRDATTAAVAFLRSPTKRRKLAKPSHGIIVAPTGSGKSLLIASIVAALEAPAIVFQPSKEILEQNLAKLRDYGYEPAVYSASIGRRETGAITLATIGSVKNLPDLFRSVRYVIVDECHLVNPKAGMYQEFFSALGDVRILGLTATPFRLSTDGYGGSILKFLTRTRPRVFSEVVHYTQTGDLFRDGYLAPLEYQIVDGFKRDAAEVNSTGADYTDESVRRELARIRFADKLVRVTRRLLAIGRKNVLVFTRFVKEAEELAAQVPGVVVVTGETPPRRREEILADYRAGRIRVVANVGVLTVGFDYPELETVVLARPTMSLALYYQMVGRVLRPHPAKASAWVVDMVDLVSQFGHLEDLVLRPGGKTGKNWEIASGDRALTNVYFGEPSSFAV